MQSMLPKGSNVSHIVVRQTDREVGRRCMMQQYVDMAGERTTREIHAPKPVLALIHGGLHPRGFGHGNDQ